jgi:hypothetical protein
MFITNVTLEHSKVYIGCGSISDARQGDVCMQSANVTWKDQAVVNWEAKEGVTSALPAGTVITRAVACGSGDATIYTHSEGQLGCKVQANVCDITDSRDAIRDAVIAKVLSVCSTNAAVTEDDVVNELDWVLSDISIQASATEWQGGNVSYSGFGSRTGGSNKSFRWNFNWSNGRAEYGVGDTTYDDSATPASMSVVVDAMLAASPLAC